MRFAFRPRLESLDGRVVPDATLPTNPNPETPGQEEEAEAAAPVIKLDFSTIKFEYDYVL